MCNTADRKKVVSENDLSGPKNDRKEQMNEDSQVLGGRIPKGDGIYTEGNWRGDIASWPTEGLIRSIVVVLRLRTVSEPSGECLDGCFKVTGV